MVSRYWRSRSSHHAQRVETTMRRTGQGRANVGAVRRGEVRGAPHGRSCRISLLVTQQKTEGKDAVWKRRLVETFAIITLGDGLIEFLAPEEHARLWVVGPESTRKIGIWFVEKPDRMRVLGAAQVALGVWLALRQYRDT